MNVTLKPELERFVEDKLRAGKYGSVNDVINDAVAALMGQEELTAADVEEMRTEVMVGIEQHRRGESRPLDMESIRKAVRQSIASDKGA